MNSFEKLFHDYMKQVCAENPDPSHDILHVERVVNVAKKLAREEGAKLEVVIPAAYLHDCVYISKTDSRRTQASRISADHAMELLKGWNYPAEFLPLIHHAIAAHSFSAKIPTETIEAKVVQDADRLDAMGAVGIFRVFAFSGLSRRALYWPEDPFCETRTPDDSTNTLDHFYVKLLRLHKALNTASAKAEGQRRLQVMEGFLDSLKVELSQS
jgi:uncharacterized protein